MDQTNDKTVESEELWRKLDKLKQEHVEVLRRFVDERPKEFIKMMCEAALGIGKTEENPFVRTSEVLTGGVERYKSYVGGLAQIVFDKLMEIDVPVTNTGYSTFLSVIADYFHFSSYLKGDEIVKEYDLMSIQHDFFNEYADPLASAVDTACHFVFEGLPLYRRVDGEQGFERLSFNDPDFIYIYKKGENFESGPITHVPDWVEGLYFKDSDWVIHQAFFSGSGELLKGEQDLRRNALRSALGLHQDAEMSVETRAVVADLKREIDRLNSELTEANAKVTSLQAESLRGKARTTALRLIGGLAMVGAELDIHSGKFEGITDVIRDLALKGVSVTDDTLRDYLKEASEVIGNTNKKG